MFPTAVAAQATVIVPQLIMVPPAQIMFAPVPQILIVPVRVLVPLATLQPKHVAAQPILTVSLVVGPSNAMFQKRSVDASTTTIVLVFMLVAPATPLPTNASALLTATVVLSKMVACVLPTHVLAAQTPNAPAMFLEALATRVSVLLNAHALKLLNVPTLL